MLAFSRVPPVPALALAEPLGKVNANAGWLAQMPHSISVSLPTPRLHVKFLAVHFTRYLFLKLWVYVKRDFQSFISSAFHYRGNRGQKSPMENVFTLYLAQGHFSRTGVC